MSSYTSAFARRARNGLNIQPGTSHRLRMKLTTTSAWVLPKETSAVAPPEVWSNKDLDPSPEEYRVWTGWTFFTYWVADLISAGGWATVASFVSLGLTWWESVLATYLGGFLVSIVITANAQVGARVHTPFAVTSRATYGYYGSKFVVISRMVIACFWLSINSYQGGGFVTQMIGAIWPSYFDLPNALGNSSGTTTRDMLSFFLFWLAQLPLMFVHPSRLGWLFATKAVVTAVVCVGTLIWAVKVAGPGASSALSNPGLRAAPGAPRFEAFMYAVTSVMGTWSTMSINIGDYARYCRRPSASYVQLAAVPLLLGTVSFFGAVSAACCYAAYGVDLYQPYDMISKWQISPGGRAAAFLGSAAWALANVVTNITANSISAANDMTSLAPKYINIKRGQVIALTIGIWGFAPWKVLNTAANFLTFMASYSIVLAPIAALLAIDFFVVKRRRLDVYELYRPDGIYNFTFGWNWRAYVALICAIAPNMPGMVNSINPNIGIGSARYPYMVSNLVGDAIACVLYVVLNKIFPAREASVEEAVHDKLPEEEHKRRLDLSSGGGNGSLGGESGEDKWDKEEPVTSVEPVVS